MKTFDAGLSSRTL